MFKRVFSFMLALVLVCSILPAGVGKAGAAQVSYDTLLPIVDKQIRAFADSIDKVDADEDAALVLANHGLFGRGKTLSVGKSHALTATIFNSELFQIGLAETCARAVQHMQRFSLTSIPLVRGYPSWYDTSSFYYANVLFKNERKYDYQDFRLMPTIRPTNLNSYDKSLVWMAGTTGVSIYITRTKVTATEMVYSVKCVVDDRFDFATSSNSGFKNLISAGGAFLFREYDWEATASFQLTVPYSCTHRSGMYRWTYDKENHVMHSDMTEGYLENKATTRTVETSEIVSYYYELDEPVRLYHDKPWVMEYDIKNAGHFGFSPVGVAEVASQFMLFNAKRNTLWAQNCEKVIVSDKIMKEYGLSTERQYIRHRYGTALGTLFTYNTKNIYTLRLENEINADGSNMIYLTVHNADTGELLMDHVPMDDAYMYESWVHENVLTSESSSGISGKDLIFNYIGDKSHPFSADYFELRIWENGEDGGIVDYRKTKVTKPTCTAQGYTNYTCSCCGYSYTGDKVKATGHNFGDWTTIILATCTESGEEQRKCKNCDHIESRTVDSIGHNYENYICTGCGDMLYIPGDVDTSGIIDVDDVLTLLWNVLFPEEYPIEAPADFDGNGVTDVDDVLTLLWYVLFPEEYPLN